MMQTNCGQCGPGFATVRVGTDILRVNNVVRSLRDFGETYLNRVYTTAEIAYCRSSPADMARRLAARFAAKEACLKVLRPTRHWLDWRTLEIVRQPGGWCEMALHGLAVVLAGHQGVRHLSVSMSHEDDYAIAVVSATLWHGLPADAPAFSPTPERTSS